METNKLQSVIREAVSGILSPATKAATAIQETAKAVLKEAAVLIPRTFPQKGEASSGTTKELHEKLYQSYISSYNRVTAKLSSVSRSDADQSSNDSEFRRLKLDESHNMNGAKLHELLFTNSGDMTSEVRADSVPFMRLSRDWGSFDKWQLDFRACAMASREGWAICYFDPFKQQYFNCFVEGHDRHVPLMAIPVLVVDTWHHAWFFDYPGEKLEAMNRFMREINWNVVEMRMMAAEMSKLQQLYAIQPTYSSDREVGMTMPLSSPPLDVLGGRVA